MGSKLLGTETRSVNLNNKNVTLSQTQGFPSDASGKEPACQCRRRERHEFDRWVGKMPWRRAWQPTPVFLLENPMDRGAWWATVHGVAKSWTRLKQLSAKHAHKSNLTRPHLKI